MSVSGVYVNIYFRVMIQGKVHVNPDFKPDLAVSSNSDDNMLKNIELFDKLSLRFNGRVLFIKDVIGDEICCWSFYGQGRKIAEVCCTSIVYATEKKQTKVTSRNKEISLCVYTHSSRESRVFSQGYVEGSVIEMEYSCHVF